MLIIAHRGASATCPENTAAAFDAAVASGAHGIELDLQLTRDGVVAIWHDRRLDRLGVAVGGVHDRDWPGLAELDAGRWWHGQATAHRPLRLEQVLEGWGGRTTLYLELKRYADRAHQQRLAHRVAELLVRYRLTRDVAILSFDAGTLRAVQQAAPEVALVRNAKWPRGLRAACRVAGQRRAVCINIAHFGPADVAPAHRAGLPVFAYTCDTPAEFDHARRLGVAAVITNRPAEAVESLATGPDD